MQSSDAIIALTSGRFGDRDRWFQQSYFSDTEYSATLANDTRIQFESFDLGDGSGDVVITGWTEGLFTKLMNQGLIR